LAICLDIARVAIKAKVEAGIAVAMHPMAKGKSARLGELWLSQPNSNRKNSPILYWENKITGHVIGLVIQTDIMEAGTLTFIKNAVITEGII
jgi:hypothetical protein